MGPWQQIEADAFLREFVRRGCPVIPVLLPDALAEPALPLFLKGMGWVDFRQQEPNPMKHLIWGITSTKRKPPAINSSSALTQPSPTPAILPFVKKAELVDLLLAFACVANARGTVLDLLNQEFPGLANKVSRRTDNQADVMEIVLTCGKHRGSLQALVNIIVYFEGESSVNTERLREFMGKNGL